MGRGGIATIDHALHVEEVADQGDHQRSQDNPHTQELHYGGPFYSTHPVPARQAARKPGKVYSLSLVFRLFVDIALSLSQLPELPFI